MSNKLKNSVHREVIKATATSVAGLVSASKAAAIATTLAAALGIAVETLGNLGEKRTKELFDSQHFVDQTVAQIKESDDFAGFVYDTWLKHNLESSEIRRKRLKKVLHHAVLIKSRDFENFTRINVVAQQISEKQIVILDIFYKEVAKQERIDRPRIQSLSGYVDSSFNLSATVFSELLEKQGVKVNREGGDGITSMLNQLSYFGLIGTHIAMDGEYYMDTNFGRIFLDYIND